MEVDEITGKIVVDEAVSDDETCWNYYHSTPETKGYGSIAGTRELCIEHIKVSYQKEITAKVHELAKAKKLFRELEEELDNE